MDVTIDYFLVKNTAIITPNNIYSRGLTKGEIPDVVYGMMNTDHTFDDLYIFRINTN